MMKPSIASLVRCLSLVALVAACGDGAGPGGHVEGERWILEEDLRIGQVDGPPEYTFAQISGIFPRPDGGLWILEYRIPELRLYDADGTFVRRVGRRGSGPGEFAGSNVCAHAGPDGEIWVEDSARRWHRFDSTGTLLGTLPVTSNLGCGARLWTQDGRMLAVDTERIPGPTVTFKSRYVEYRLAPEMDRMIAGDTVPVPETGAGRQFSGMAGVTQVVVPVPFAPQPGAIFTVDGFWATRGEGRYVIERLGLTGERLFVIEHEHPPVAIPDSLRRAQHERLTSQLGLTDLNLSDLPSVYPPFERMIPANDGRLWVLRRISPEAFELDVFSPTGEYIATASSPGGLERVSIYRITAEHVYGVDRDDLDVPYVVRLAIRRL